MNLKFWKSWGKKQSITDENSEEMRQFFNENEEEQLQAYIKLTGKTPSMMAREEAVQLAQYYGRSGQREKFKIIACQHRQEAKIRAMIAQKILERW